MLVAGRKAAACIQTTIFNTLGAIRDTPKFIIGYCAVYKIGGNYSD
jgi:hypothetical protein